MRVRKYDYITPILKSLHWLPISFRIAYKVSLLIHQCMHGEAPPYLKELLTLQSSTRTILSISPKPPGPSSVQREIWLSAQQL